MFDFSASLNDGKYKADNIERMREQFNVVFSDLEKELSLFIGNEVRLGHYIEYEFEENDNSNSILSSSYSILSSIATAGSSYVDPFKKRVRKKTGYFEVRIEPSDSDSPSENLFKYKESKSVFPVDILFERDEIRCSDQEELVNGLKYLLSDGQFHLKLRKFISKFSSE